MEVQLRLFPRPKPLVEKLGAQFFRSIPKQPGVYMMHACGRLLYVGKAGNLRQRLGSYRYTNDRTSRKTLRLLHSVETITWETCGSEPEACLRENQLLREHRPKFNRANTYPRAYPFIEVKSSGTGLSMRVTTEANEHCYGAFKGGGRMGFAALVRLSWSMLHANHSYATLPRELLLPKLREWSFPSTAELEDLMRAFLCGSSDRLLRMVESVTESDSPFHQAFKREDLAMAEHFYVKGPQRNCHWRSQLGLTALHIAQEQLDDLPLLVKRSGEHYSSASAVT